MPYAVAPIEGHEWRLFSCSTEAGEPGECKYEYLAPVPLGASPDVSGPLDTCPECGQYLTFCGSRAELQVTRG